MASKEQGLKLDAEKDRWDLLPWSATEQVVKVLTYGARKYAPENWRKIPDAGERYWAATQRHLSAFRQGEWIDGESGLPHLAHAMCCLTFLLTLGIDEAKERR